jgi:DNA-binding beta-propeller fold protein YncE
MTNKSVLVRCAIGAGVLVVALFAGGPSQNPATAAAESYTQVKGWPQVPSSVPMGFVSWVATDADGQMYVFRRCPVKCSDGPHPGAGDPPASILTFDKTGKYLTEWEPKSGGKAKEAHGLYIDRSGFIWTTDVLLHVVRKYRSDGTLLMTLGKVGVPGVTNDTFNKPTNVIVAADSSIFVTDGYGNQRVVKFDKDGKFVKAWGKVGTAPGEFRIPHALAQDRSGRIIIADRCGLGETGCKDGRLQVFDQNGQFVTQWTTPSKEFAPFALSVDTSDRLYVDDTQNNRTWILEAASMKVLATADGVSGHGMWVTPSGSDIYVTGTAAGIRRFTRAQN